MRTLFKLIALSLLFISPLAADQEDIATQAGTDKNQINIGDNLNLNVSIKYNQGFSVEAPEKLPELKDWEIKDFKKEIQNKDNVQQLNLTYTLTTFTTGEVTIPELGFNFKDGQGKEGQIKTQSIKVNVESLLSKEGDKGDILDIKPPFYLRTPLSTYILWLLILAAIAAVAYFWYRNYQKRKGALMPEAYVPKIPPSVTALEELEKLRNSDLIKEGRIKEFYIALSDIIRDFLSATYKIQTRDRTTSEVYLDLRNKMSDKKALNIIKDFFEECDLVKFAKYRPDEPVCLEDLETGVKIVENT